METSSTDPAGIELAGRFDYYDAVDPVTREIVRLLHPRFEMDRHLAACG